jgi:membrane-bound serine protease (ClpP class)
MFIVAALLPRHAAVLGALVAWLWLGSAAVAQEAKEPPPDDGVFITVNNLISSEAVNRVRTLADEAKAGKAGRVISKIIFDFNPSDKESSSPDFGPCYDLAEYIKNLHNITTVAYVHHKVSRHTVLPVLACKELVMGGADGSWIGRIVDDPRVKLDPPKARIYEQFAGEPRAAIVQKMFDANVELMKGRRNNSEFYFDKRRQDEAVALGVVGGEPVMPAGELAFLNSDECLRLGLCKLANKLSRRQVAEIYGLSSASLRHDPLRGRAPKARLMVLKGEVNASMKESMLRRIRRAIESDEVNTVFLQFQEGCGNGSPQIAREIADKLREWVDDEKKPLQVIAFVPYKAVDTAAMVALGCSDIVMSEDAAFGDFSAMVGIGGDPRKVGNAGRDIGPLKKFLADLLEATDRDPVLAEGLLDPDSELYRVRTKKGAFERRIITGEELARDQQSADPRWQTENQLKHKGSLLILNAALARELGIARHVVKTREIREVFGEYGIEPDKVLEITPDWLDQIASFLRLPQVRFFLVMIGITCLILEFKIPGATAPGVIAAICFVLFFWAQSQLSGQIIILAILLFLLGLICIGVEVFVLPGFGFVGVSGILLMVIGLGLATVERMPQHSDDWWTLTSTLSQFGFGIVFAVFMALVLARYLPKIPYANRLVLPSAGDNAEAGEDAAALPGVDQAIALLGAIGTSATDLRPAGMARFGEQFVDVVTDGNFIPASARVQVIEVEGTRIVVKEV